MPSFTSEFYARHYAPIQREKYAEVWPLLQPLLSKHAPRTLVDFGVGPAWLETFLEEKGLSFDRVVGVDISEEAISLRKKGIDYRVNTLLSSSEKFDLVIAWDAWHCFPTLRLEDYLSPNGLLLLAEPAPFVSLLEPYVKNALLDVWVGKQERSRVVVWGKKSYSSFNA